MMMKMRKVAGRMHVHTADYELVVIEGIMKHWRALRPDPGREALEALAVEGYRSGVLTHYQASQLLHMSRLEFDAFLKARQIDDHAYDVEDLEQDLATLEQLEAAGRMPRS